MIDLDARLGHNSLFRLALSFAAFSVRSVSQLVFFHRNHRLCSDRQTSACQITTNIREANSVRMENFLHSFLPIRSWGLPCRQRCNPELLQNNSPLGHLRPSCRAPCAQLMYQESMAERVLSSFHNLSGCPFEHSRPTLTLVLHQSLISPPSSTLISGQGPPPSFTLVLHHNIHSSPLSVVVDRTLHIKRSSQSQPRWQEISLAQRHGTSWSCSRRWSSPPQDSRSVVDGKK